MVRCKNISSSFLRYIDNEVAFYIAMPSLGRSPTFNAMWTYNENDFSNDYLTNSNEEFQV